MYNRLYKIKRLNFGWFHRKYGILTDPLPKVQKDLLKNNKFIKKVSEDDHTLHILFRIADMESLHKGNRKYWFNPYQNKITTYSDIEVDYDNIEWYCAICNKDIIINMYERKPKYFYCNECRHAYYKVRFKIDKKVIESSVNFTLYCKNLLKEEHQNYIKYTKRNR